MTQIRWNLDTLFVRWDWWCSLFVVVVGLVLIIYEFPFIETVTRVATGGAILGTGISSIMTILASHSREEELRLILNGSIPYKSFNIEEKSLTPYRNIFHYYYTTETADGAFWYYTILDFSKDFARGKLVTSYVILDQTYTVEGFLKRDCLIITIHNRFEDREIESINIFSDFNKHSQYEKYGIQIHEIFDNSREIGRCILSRTPLTQTPFESFVENSEARRLQKQWDDNMNELRWKILPTTS